MKASANAARYTFARVWGNLYRERGEKGRFTEIDNHAKLETLANEKSFKIFNILSWRFLVVAMVSLTIIGFTRIFVG